MLTDIQYFSAHYVTFKDNLTEDEKRTLIKWIKVSPDDKIKSLLIRGDYKFHQEAVEKFDRVFWVLTEAVPDPVGLALKSTKDTGFVGGIGNKKMWTGIVDVDKLNSTIDALVRKNVEHGYEAGKQAGKIVGKKAGMVQGLATAAIAALIITISYRFYKRFLSKAARVCRGKKFSEKTSCMNRYRIEAMKGQMLQLQKGFKICSKTKNPKKCKYKITKKIRRLKVKLGAL
jgi:hypothetical protein